jgi:hypothetical protein
VFDALTSERVYRPAFTSEQAVGIMLAGRGTQFDRTVLDASSTCGRRSSRSAGGCRTSRRLAPRASC